MRTYSEKCQTNPNELSKNRPKQILLQLLQEVLVRNLVPLLCSPIGIWQAESREVLVKDLFPVSAVLVPGGWRISLLLFLPSSSSSGGLGSSGGPLARERQS